MSHVTANDELPFDASQALDTFGSSCREIKVEQALEAADGAITPEVMLFYAQRAAEMKEKIDQHGAEINQRQDKMRLINEVISEINRLTDEQNQLNLSHQSDLLKKLDVLKQLGVKIFEGKTQFSATERDRLIENLHLQGDSWDKENKMQTQRMEIYIKELDRVMMLLKEVQKNENQAKRGATSGIRG